MEHAVCRETYKTSYDHQSLFVVPVREMVPRLRASPGKFRNTGNPIIPYSLLKREFIIIITANKNRSLGPGQQVHMTIQLEKMSSYTGPTPVAKKLQVFSSVLENCRGFNISFSKFG